MRMSYKYKFNAINSFKMIVQYRLALYAILIWLLNTSLQAVELSLLATMQVHYLIE